MKTINGRIDRLKQLIRQSKKLHAQCLAGKIEEGYPDEFCEATGEMMEIIHELQAKIKEWEARDDEIGKLKAENQKIKDKLGSLTYEMKLIQTRAVEYGRMSDEFEFLARKALEKIDK